MAGAWAGGFCQNAPGTAFRLAVQLLVPCSAEHTGQPIPIKGSSERLCLDVRPFLTEKDVESAETRRNSAGQTVILCTFHEAAARRELQVTLKNVGQRIAIQLNGQVIATPTIASGSRMLYLDGGFTPQQAQALVLAFYRQAAGR